MSEWPSFEAKWKELTGNGLRLVAIDTYKEGSKRIFAGVYRAGKQGHALWVGPNWQQFLAKRLEFAKQGLQLVDVASYAEGGQQLFAGVFAASADPIVFKRGTWDELIQDWQQLSSQGRRLVSLDTSCPDRRSDFRCATCPGHLPGQAQHAGPGTSIDFSSSRKLTLHRPDQHVPQHHRGADEHQHALLPVAAADRPPAAPGEQDHPAGREAEQDRRGLAELAAHQSVPASTAA
ncbi:MAG: hypothetical protein WDN24_18650 [Sphingomonas sp.]